MATQPGPEHTATAKALNLHISTKHSVMISDHLRYRSVLYAKKCLEDVVKLRTAIPFTRFNKDRGHKPGMAAGRYPEKAAKEFLKLVKSVEANAQARGLDPGNLKIIKLVSNKAAMPFTGGRTRHSTKRTHLEIAVQQGSAHRTNQGQESRNSKDNNSHKRKGAASTTTSTKDTIKDTIKSNAGAHS